MGVARDRCTGGPLWATERYHKKDSFDEGCVLLRKLDLGSSIVQGITFVFYVDYIFGL